MTEIQSLVFWLLSVVPGESFDLGMGCFLGGLSADGARPVLDQLRELQLIQETKDQDYFTMHSLLRQFAREQLSSTEAAEQVTRALAFSCTLAREAELVIRSLVPVHDAELSGGHAESVLQERDQALEWMEKQHKNLVATVERACIDRQADIAWEKCRALVEFFEIRGKWESWRQTHEAAEKVVPKQSLGFAHVSSGEILP